MIAPQRASRRGETNRQRENETSNGLLPRKTVAGKPARPLGTLSKALDQAQWDRLRWDVETAGGGK
jgi:hypothetical protein